MDPLNVLAASPPVLKKVETKLITKETVQRLARDIKQLKKTPLTDNGIHYEHDEEDMLKGYAMIVGPEDTPYFGGFYCFEFHYPADYPHTPPTVIYCTNGDGIRFNPNLYKCGKVCISLLNTWRGEQWTSCQTISTILLTLCTLLNAEPLLNEPGVTKSHADFYTYNKIVEYKNVEIAVLQMLERKPGVLLPPFERFYPVFLESFAKNAEAIEGFLHAKEPIVTTFKTHYYKMQVPLDYASLIQKFQHARTQFIDK